MWGATGTVLYKACGGATGTVLYKACGGHWHKACGGPPQQVRYCTRHVGISKPHPPLVSGCHVEDTRLRLVAWTLRTLLVEGVELGRRKKGKVKKS